MLRFSRFTALLGLVLLVACDSSQTPKPDVVITTDIGDIEIHLYADAPQHRANFLKLAKAGFYDGTSFHRIVPGFVLQGGDPTSRRLFAADSVRQRDSVLLKQLGLGGPGYEIAAEINPKRIHKRGALAAARIGDSYNPKRQSSGSQFYIVTGRRYSDAELDNAERERFYALEQQFTMNYVNRPEQAWLREITRDQFALQKLQVENPDSMARLRKRFDAERVKMQRMMAREMPAGRLTLAQRRAYIREGGVPELDGSYTVFGEVTKGMDVVDSLMKRPLDPRTGWPASPTTVKVKVLSAE